MSYFALSMVILLSLSIGFIGGAIFTDYVRAKNRRAYLTTRRQVYAQTQRAGKLSDEFNRFKRTITYRR